MRKVEPKQAPMSRVSAFPLCSIERRNWLNEREYRAKGKLFWIVTDPVTNEVQITADEVKELWHILGISEEDSE